MNPLVTVIAPIVVLLAAQSPGQTQETAARRYELPNLDSLELKVPPAWDEIVDQPVDGGPPTIQFRPREGAAFEIYITPDWPNAPDEAVPDPETLRETVRGEAEQIRDRLAAKSRSRRTRKSAACRVQAVSASISSRRTAHRNRRSSGT